ncbi:HD domain-containing protein [Paenibacillus sp. 453mf]|uniref:HD domain-containing protein n=1 Tax=Paenibacillus sp. 453mf TaxID=1761874 RepID=UPI0008E83B60|nr:HD domain-containing protein [Paenibacillus sp. 453mf]SFS41528.1 putative HD superfamily hydrolase of NAD metabolism [Paenibacillus sp. 453mf]
MDSILEKLTLNMTMTGDLRSDVYQFLLSNHCPKTAEHCMEVGAESHRVAGIVGANQDQAEIAGWLHDISAVFPNNQRINAARELDIKILSEEEAFPMIIHQKLSRLMAERIFQINDLEILEAVGCHTTLRSHSTQLDQVLFVADKIVWDQVGEPPSLKQLKEALEISLPQAAFCYIQYLWERKDSLKVIHPWLREAYEELNAWNIAILSF